MTATTTTFPDWVRHQIGCGWVLVAKSAMDFVSCVPDLEHKALLVPTKQSFGGGS